MRASVLVVLLTAIMIPALAAQTDDKEERAAPSPPSISKTAAEKLLVHRVDPVWKHHDMEARVFGTVVLRITVGTKGHVSSIQVISGPAMLQQPVKDAVRQWEYRPYLVNGRPVEFSTKVLVTYSNF